MIPPTWSFRTMMGGNSTVPAMAEAEGLTAEDDAPLSLEPSTPADAA
jgi:hypothetical protein